MVPQNAREHAMSLPKRRRVVDLVDEQRFGGSFDGRGGEAGGFGDADVGAVDDAAGEGSMSLESAARDYVWLYDSRRGIACEKIAAEDGVTVRAVRKGIERALKLEAQCSEDSWLGKLQSNRGVERGFFLTPMFPIGAFTPQSTCPHGGPLQPGSTICCMVCHASGMDDHPSMRRDAATDPAPESGLESEFALTPVAAAIVPSPTARRRETRRDRRRRLFEALARI